jgi:hypothetical protein
MPEEYTTGDTQYEAKLARAVRSVRAGEYEHMRCPDHISLDGQSVQESPATSEAAEASEVLQVMEDVTEAEKAAEKARLLTSAAKRESAALGQAETGSQEVAEVMRLAAAAESQAARKARKASEALKQLAEKRKAQAAEIESNAKKAKQAEEEAAAKKEEEVKLETEAQVAEEAAENAVEQIAPVPIPSVAVASAAVGNGTDVNSSTGCCFAYAYAAMKEPCCLVVHQVDDKSLCDEQADIVAANRTGQTGFTLGGCPATAADAEALMNPNARKRKLAAAFPSAMASIMILAVWRPSK